MIQYGVSGFFLIKMGKNNLELRAFCSEKGPLQRANAPIPS